MEAFEAEQALEETNGSYLVEERAREGEKVGLPELLLKRDPQEGRGDDVTALVRSRTKLPNLWKNTWTSRLTKSIKNKDSKLENKLENRLENRLHKSDDNKQDASHLGNEFNMATGNMGHLVRLSNNRPRVASSTSDESENQELWDESPDLRLDSNKTEEGEVADSNPLPVQHQPKKRQNDHVKDAIRMARIVTRKIKKDRQNGYDNSKIVTHSEFMKQIEPALPSASTGFGTDDNSADNSFVDTRNNNDTALFSQNPKRYQPDSFYKRQDFTAERQPHQWKVDITIIDEGYEPENIEKPAAQRGKGRLHRNLHPCTNAMLKLGTSPSQARARVLREGEIDVSKVWRRPTTLFDTPFVMAREDTTVL